MEVTCTCKICGREFLASRRGMKICSGECRKIAQKEFSKAWYLKNTERAREQKREERERKRLEDLRKSDKIVAIGYAERQMADSLRRAGRVNTEL